MMAELSAVLMEGEQLIDPHAASLLPAGYDTAVRSRLEATLRTFGREASNAEGALQGFDGDATPVAGTDHELARSVAKPSDLVNSAHPALMGSRQKRAYRGAAFNPLLWKQFLNRNHVYSTLCWRCANVLGLQRTPTGSERSDANFGAALTTQVSTLRNGKSRMHDFTWRVDARETDRGSPVLTSDASLDNDLDDDPADVFPEWTEVEITQTGRMMLLAWARRAAWGLSQDAR
jgi:hypothetical protein